MTRTLCTVDDCGRPVVGNGYCGMHYQRWRNHGDPNIRFEYWPPAMVFQLDDMLNQGWSDERISRKLGRSASAVKKARMRLGLNARYRQARTARQVARIMGVHHMTPQRWIGDGRLKAVRNGARYGRHRVYQINESDLLDFVEDSGNWQCYDPLMITDEDLRGWAVRLRGDVTFITVKEAARRLDCAYTHINWLAERGHFRIARDGGIVWVDEQSFDTYVAGQREDVAA